MKFGRRQWDAWCLRALLILSLGGLAHCVLSGHFSVKALAYPGAALSLVPIRFIFSVEGEEYPPLRRLTRQEYIFGLLCVLFIIGFLSLIPVIKKTLNYLWAWALFDCAFLSMMFWLAFRIDRARRIASG